MLLQLFRIFGDYLMRCSQQSSQAGSDRLELVSGDRPFDLSATAWLVGEAVRQLHAADAGGKLAYRHVTELLRARQDVVETIIQLGHGIGQGDVSLRWSLLHLLGDAADETAGDHLVRAAIEPLPEDAGREGCEGPRDTEMLVRTMAVEALAAIAARHREGAELLLKVVSERPARPILIEAAKAAAGLGLKDQVQDILPAEDQWILGIRKASVDEIRAERERADGTERGFTPPKMGSQFTAPSSACCCHQE
jgi:hypothetical protein